MAKKTKARVAALERRLRTARRQADEQAAKTAKSIRRLERRLAALEREQRALRKRVKRLTRLTRGWDAGPPRPPGPPWPGGPRRGKGGPPWARGIGPVVSFEVPLETDDPGAPLWATVAARLPEEIATVDDDGREARYRYSAVGSTPQAPRYRRLAGPPGQPGTPATSP
jgi:hypothetical protein